MTFLCSHSNHICWDIKHFSHTLIVSLSLTLTIIIIVFYGTSLFVLHYDEFFEGLPPLICIIIIKIAAKVTCMYCLH